MKNHYRTEAEWYANHEAAMASREPSSSLDERIRRQGLTHSKTIPIARTTGELEIKAVEPSRRTFSGIASTPELDRAGDMIDPAGVTYRNPLPLLFHHDPKQPIGSVILTTRAEGIVFEATLPHIDDPGPLKERVDEAWQSVKAGIITGVSIGHRVLAGGVEWMKSGARRLTKTEICEVSLVTIPANANATILTVKSLAAPAPRGDRYETNDLGTHPEPRAHTADPDSADVMTARDAILWKSGREKVEAGRPLTDTEIEVLVHYGGERMLRPTRRAAGTIERKWITGGLAHSKPFPITRIS